MRLHTYVHPIADRVAQHPESISETFPTNQNSAHGIYDDSQVIYEESHENTHIYNPPIRLHAYVSQSLFYRALLQKDI